MHQGFWQTLNRPFIALAPLDDVTDAAFRGMFVRYGKPDVFWTEFVSADGLESVGRERIMHKLLYHASERPIVAQLFTAKPENMERATRTVVNLGFDGIDINMGCPDRTIEKQGCGASLIRNPQLAQELIQAAQTGAGTVPVSVKTRLGYNADELETWLPHLLAVSPVAVSIHARTRKEMSRVPARWERIKRAVEIRNEQGSNALIIGNGDVSDLADARRKAEESGCDGVMMGRAIFGNPWAFNETTYHTIKTSQEKLHALLEHAELFRDIFNGKKSFAPMKRNISAYVRGFDGAKEIRETLMEAETAEDLVRRLQGIEAIDSYPQ